MPFKQTALQPWHFSLVRFVETLRLMDSQTATKAQRHAACARGYNLTRPQKYLRIRSLEHEIKRFVKEWIALQPTGSGPYHPGALLDITAVRKA